MGTPSARYLKSKGLKPEKAEPEFQRHPNPVKFIEIPRCQAMTRDGTQCKNESSRWDFCHQHRNAK